MKPMKFKITFDDTYEFTGIKEVGTSFFSDEQGYTALDTGKVAMLDVGESISLDDNHQSIERIS